MRKIIIGFSALLFLFACDSAEKKDAKKWCADDWGVTSAKTTTAAKYAFEACMIRKGF